MSRGGHVLFVSNTSRSLVFLALLLSSQALQGCEKSSAAVQATPVKASLVWDDKRSHGFELELTTVARLSGTPSATPLVLRSGMELSFRGVGSTRQVLVKLLHPRLVDKQGSPAQDAGPFEVELGKPFGVELSNGVIAAYLEPGAQGQVAGFRRHIASALQWADHDAQSAWKSKEWDATGLANVAYQAVPNAPNTWDWQKLGYERLTLTEKRAAQALDTSKVAPSVQSAKGRLVTDSSGIVSVDRNEKLSVPLSESASLTTDITLAFKRTSFGAAATSGEWSEAEKTWQRALAGTPAVAADPALTDQARIGSHTFPELVNTLTELEAKHQSALPSAAEAGPLFHALVGIFRQQPEQIEPALKLIVARAPIHETLLDALAMASSPRAIDALAKVALDHALPLPLRVRAAGSLIRAHQPGASALEAAVKMIGDPALRENGLYGVGSFTRQLREQGNAALADTGTQVLAAQLKGSTEPSDQATVLLAISNSGSPELFDLAVSYQKHKNATVRHAALEAIRLMSQAAVETRLREALDRPDRSDVVAALHALGRRPAATRESVDRVEALAKGDPSADVRREAALVLGLWSQMYPALVRVLADLRDHDPDQRVRDVAKPIAAQ